MTKKLNNKNVSFLLKTFILFIPIFLTKFFFDIRTNSYHTYEPMGLEDGLFENIQVVIFFITCMLSGVLSYKELKQENKFKSAFWGLLCLGTFFVTMEEISWGQRLFGIESQGIFEVENIQGETNIHNFPIFHNMVRYVNFTIGLWATLGWLLKKQIKTALDKIKYIRELNNHIFVPWFLVTYFFLLLINFWDTWFLAPQDHEYFELLFSMGVLLFTIYHLLIFKFTRTQSNS